MLEKILEEFTEPHFGYLKINVVIKPMSIGEKINVDEKIKFYFWVNVCGITTGVSPTTGLVNQILKNYNPKYISALPKSVNGFKMMNDEKEMLQLLLPEVLNQGDLEYKMAISKREAEALEAFKEKERLKASRAAGGVADGIQPEETEQEQIVEQKVTKKMNVESMRKNMANVIKSGVKIEKKNQIKKKQMLAQATLLNSMSQMVSEFYSDANPINIPTFYEKKTEINNKGKQQNASQFVKLEDID